MLQTLKVLHHLSAASRDPQRRLRLARKSRHVGLATTLALMACGYGDEGNAWTPLNAVSHIAWGDEALEQKTFSVKYTLVGALLSVSSVGGWAALHEMLCGEAEEREQVGVSLAGAVGVAALAWLIDYKVVPRRLQPGFESRVTRRSMWLIYAVLAVALAGSGVFQARARRAH